MLVPPDSTLEGLHPREITVIGGSTVTEAVCELVPKVAVTTTDWVVATVPAVAVKVALVAPAATVTDAGSVSAELLSVNETVVAETAA